jgi:hypothetical protein
MTKNKDLLDLSPFTEGIRSKFQIIQDAYEMLTIFNNQNPLQHKDYLVKMRYPIGVEFFETFALIKLDYEEMNFALNCIYAYIGLEAVIDRIAHFTGLQIKVEEKNYTDKKLTISIISENIFDLNLFQQKLTDFLRDVLLFSNLDFIFDVIVLDIKLSYNKTITSITTKQDIIPLEITGTITI